MLTDADTLVFRSLALAIESIWVSENAGVVVAFYTGIYAPDESLHH